MTDSEDDSELFDDEDRRRAHVIRRARVEGIEIAYRSAIEVCSDPKSPAQAKSAAQRTLLQIGGMLDRADRQSSQEKPAAEMSPAELAAAVAEITRVQKSKKRAPAKDTPSSVFD